MLYKACVSLFFICWLLHAHAFSYTMIDSIENKKVEYRFALGVQIGTDIGGAIPVPISYIPKTFNPSPKIYPSIGAKLTFPIVSHWALGVETTYKKIGMDADARVKNQKFKDTDRPGEKDLIVSYSGTAEMTMDFPMLEVPVYAKYTFRSGKDRILFGPYFAWMINSKFKIIAKKGYTLDKDGEFDMEVDNNLNINFSQSLSSWDIGGIVGYEREITNRIELGLRMMTSFKDIFRKGERYLDYKMINMRGCVVISYNLFDIKPIRLNLRKK